MASIVIRAAAEDDLDALWDFLAIAAYEQDATSARDAPGVAAYLHGWPRSGDFGFVAERDGAVVGAAWARQFAADEGKAVYGSPQTPKVTIGVRSGLRGRGIGQKLLRNLIAEAESRRLGLCLSVRSGNPARHLYERLGFRAVPGSEYPNRVGGSSVGMLLGGDIETFETRVVYENRWMRVREDGIRRRDGSEGIYGVVEKPDFVVIVPLEVDGRIHLVQQYRYPVRGRYWEFPQGSWEATPRADPADVARAELREETGLIAATMVHVGHLFEVYGYCNQGYHVYLATGLQRGDTDLDHEEQDLVSRALPLSEFERMIREGEIKDATTVAAFSLLRFKGLL